MNPQPPSGAVIFDLDGVLVESESLKARAHSAAVGELGGRVSPSYYSHVMGASHEFVRQLSYGKAISLSPRNDTHPSITGSTSKC